MPNRLTLSDARDAIRQRRLSAVELVDAYLAEIERRNPELKAFVTTFPSAARAAAVEADKSLTDRPLHGIPITIKDSFDMRGLPTLCGSRLRLSHRAESDSAVVRGLRDAGAIVLGKTNCPEFLANYETDNAITGWTANPHNPDRSAGGSSGGEAAAIAAFCSAGGVGSDGGGSIRVPAHFCGIAGLKPTPGRVSAAGHFPQISHPGGLLGVAGPMARTARDLRIMFRVLSKYDPADPFAAPVVAPPREVARVGVMEQFADVPVQESARVAVWKAARMLQDLRIAVEPFDCPEIHDAPDVWWFFFTELTASFTRELIEAPGAQPHWTGTEFVSTVDPERQPSGREVVEKLGQRDAMRVALLRAMENVPVLLLPVCGVTAFRARERSWPVKEGRIDLRQAMAPSSTFNLLGLPALTIPMGRDEQGLPVGIQLVGRPWEEETLLELAVRMES